MDWVSLSRNNREYKFFRHYFRRYKYMTTTIYKLCSDECPSFYIGSTARDLKHRLSKHKNKSHESPGRRIYKTILSNGGFSKWYMITLETIETDNRLTRKTREQHWIDEMNPDMNSIRVLG